jgi:AcrR family transcriptional regulator
VSTTTTRQTAAERRETVLDAATKEFAAKGLHGASTDDIARAAGISQPYLFRLFRTKKELYLATTERSIAELNEMFTTAAAGKTGREALEAMGDAYTARMSQDRDRLMLMLKCWASCDDPEICAVSREAWRQLTAIAEGISGEPPDVVSAFFANGVLLTIFMSMQLFERPEPWADRIIRSCSTALGQ